MRRGTVRVGKPSSDPSQSPASGGGAWLTRLALMVWGASLVTICAYLLGGHLLTLPAPELDDPVLRAGIDRRRGPEDAGAWMALHILYGDCGCSRRVIGRLADRGPSALARERVVLVDPREGDRAQLADAGFPVEVMTPETLERSLGVQAAPLLVVAGPDGALRYVGGYTDRKRGPEIEDLAIIRAARAGGRPDAHPLFGCAVNVELARAVDPFGLR